MLRRHLSWAAACWTAYALLAATACFNRSLPTAGVLTDHAAPGYTAAMAGLEVGDLILAWRRPEGEAIPITSPLHLHLVELTEAPLGTILLSVERASQPLEISLPGGRWELSCRPRLDRASERIRRRAVELQTNRNTMAATGAWFELEAHLHQAGRAEAAAWAWLQATILQITAQPDRLEPAIDDIDHLPISAELTAQLTHDLGTGIFDVGLTGEAAVCLERAVDRWRTLDLPLGAAASFYRLSRPPYRAVIESDRAIEIYKDLADGSIELAMARVARGSQSYVERDVEGARRDYERAMADLQRLAPHGLLSAILYRNLSIVANREGDIRAASKLIRRSMEIAEAIDPSSEHVGYAANSLGLLSRDLGDLVSARRSSERALAIFAAKKPDGPEVAGCLNNLANITAREKDFAASKDYHQQALEIRQRLDPDSRAVAASLHNLGSVLRRSGELELAQTHFKRALELKRAHSPNSMLVATTLMEIAEVALAQGRLTEAEALHREALHIHRRTSGRSDPTANSLFALGLVIYRDGRADEAEALWREAIDIVRDRRQLLGLPVDQASGYRSRFFWFHRQLAELLAEQGRHEEAFVLLEEVRAAGLVELLRRRGDDEDDDSQQRRQLNRQLARVEARLSRSGAEDPPSDLAALRQQISRLEQAVSELDVDEPGWTTSSESTPSDLISVARALDPGTVLLSFSVGRERTVLQAITPGENGSAAIVSHILDIDEETLERQVGLLGAFIERGREHAIDGALIRLSARLFTTLLEPVSELITSASRLLIVPDGPLFELPFAALVTGTDPLTYLGQTTVLSFVPSATVFTEIKRRRPVDNLGRVVIFGDPRPNHLGEDHGFEALPGTRDEASAIAALFPGRAELHLGSEVTEERVLALYGDVSVLHFAAHAVLDRDQPMASALILSVPDARSPDAADGRLSAREIVDHLTIRADLVILSACSTARGRWLSGEGVQGLARAFQLAGARSLVVSQWAVSDRSTRVLMTALYEQIRDGKPCAVALHETQRKMSTAPIVLADGTTVDLRHPYHWAAFQLNGDWR